MDKPLPREVAETVSTLCRDIDTPRSLTVFLLLKFQEYDQLANLRCDPVHYFDAHSFGLDNSMTELLRKCASLPTTVDKRKQAVDSFFSSEKLCTLTNERLVPYILGFNEDVAISKFFDMVKMELSSLLGRTPSEDDINGRFGPGAVYESKRSRTLVPDKLSTKPTLTEGALCLLPLWSQTAWGRISSSAFDKTLEVVRGNRFTSVPKTSLTDRGICIEPSINGFFQMAIGKLIREKLRREGLDLNSSWSAHRQLARQSSIDGLLATIDLSNASDTVSHSLVRLLIPEGWFFLLDSVRSPFTLIGGQQHRLAKFSSMGNGFTFELETLIFYALCKVVLRIRGIKPVPLSNLAVFGDDIIVPVSCVELLQSVLSFCGFTVNTRKSFSTGVFRESCGGDFFLGTPVRAFYLKEYPNEPQDYIAMANGVRRVANQDSGIDDIHPCYLRGWRRIVDYVPIHAKFFGPSELGDLVIHDRSTRWIRRTRNSIHFVKTYSPLKGQFVLISRYDPDTVLASAVYGILTDQGKLYRRGPVMGYKPAWVPYS